MGALLLLLVAPANPEVYLNSINSQSVLCAAAGIVLISEPGGCADRLGKWVVLGLAGLSGVAATFLAPLFWVQWWLERRRERLTQALILSACALVQFVFISRGMAQDQRHLRFNSTAMVGAAYAKFIAMPLAPARPASRHLAQLRQTAEETGALPGWVWFVTAAGCAAFLLVCWRSGNRAALLLAAAAVWVGLLSFCGSRDATSDQQLLAHMTTPFVIIMPRSFLFSRPAGIPGSRHEPAACAQGPRRSLGGGCSVNGAGQLRLRPPRLADDLLRSRLGVPRLSNGARIPPSRWPSGRWAGSSTCLPNPDLILPPDPFDHHFQPRLLAHLRPPIQQTPSLGDIGDEESLVAVPPRQTPVAKSHLQAPLQVFE